ncbi:MAG: Coenzyme F420 hydrogenase/dehydrogenase, beta subunit C-terminal domain [bacterium]
MKVHGPNELVNDVQDGGLCIGCGACVNLCPYFRNYRGKTSALFPCTLAQGRCHASCPKAEVDLDELAGRYWGTSYAGTPLGTYREILGARAGTKMQAGSFQGGGTVSALVTLALKRKRIDAAILTGCSGIEPVPRIATRPKEISACGSSKFISAPTLAAMNQAVREGRRRLAVVGTPCQMTAVAQMRLNPLAREDFVDPVALTVGLFCNWSLDHRGLTAFLKKRVDLGSIRSMDIPPPPANLLVLHMKEGKVEIPLDEVRPLIPETCSICPDMTAEWADVSVGMYEGRPGWNTLVVRTDRGAALVEEAQAKGFLETEPMPDAYTEGLKRAVLQKKQRAVRAAMKREVLNTSQDGKRSVLRIRPEVVESILSQ